MESNGTGFTNIDALPLGKLLKPKQEKGIHLQIPGGSAGKIRKIRRKGYK